MMMVPKANDSLGQAKVNPQDIDKLQIDQKTLCGCRLQQRTTPELNGVVTASPPTSLPTSAPGRAITPSASRFRPEEVARLGETQDHPGMPVEAFVQTGRTHDVLLSDEAVRATS